METLFNIFSRKPLSFDEEVEQFFKAIKKGDVPKMQRTIDKYASALEWKDADGSSCALTALQNNQLAAMSCLLSRGMDVNTRIYENEAMPNTSLHFATEHNQADFVQLLLDNGADTTLKGRVNVGMYAFILSEKTPIEIAQFKKYYNLVNLFTAHAHNDNTSLPTPDAMPERKFEL